MRTQTKQYKQLTQGQRYQIEALLEKRHSQKEIAKIVGISESALSRKLKRNSDNQGYCAESAHTLALERRKSAKKHSCSHERQMPIIEKALFLGWSPENISYRMKHDVPDIALSHTTINERIATNKAQRSVLYKALPRVSHHTG